MKYYKGSIVQVNGKKFDKCSICGESKSSYSLTEDKKYVCFTCWKNDTEREEIEDGK